MTGEFVTAGHLGGYVAGGDPDTTYPQMWNVITRAMRHARTSITMLDIGCGDGATMRAFRDLGWDVVHGVDGVPQSDGDIVRHDYSTGPVPEPLLLREYDLVWSCEFVEHVPHEHRDAYMADMTRGRRVMMTHALPGQPGHHHVNCQPDDYWIELFAEYGYHLDVEATRLYRAVAELNGRPAESNYFARTGMVFAR